MASFSSRDDNGNYMNYGPDGELKSWSNRDEQGNYHTYTMADLDAAEETLTQYATQLSAIAAFVLGLASFFFFWSLIVPGLAVLFGIVSLGSFDRARHGVVNRVFAIIGLVLGGLGLLVGILIIKAAFS